MGTLPHLSVLKGATRPLKTNLLHKIFEDIAATEAADNPALIFEDGGNTRKHTYAEVNSLTNRLARGIGQEILEQKLSSNKDGDYIIAVCMHPSDKLLVTLLAIWKSGAAYLPLDPSFPRARVEHIIRESKPIMVIYEEDSDFYVNTFKLPFNDLYTKSENLPSNSMDFQECVQHLKDDLAIVLYTSGSTGVPKGVRLPHRTILNRLQWQFKTFPYSKTEKIGVFKTALTFVDSVAEIWGPLISGLAILVVPKTTTQDPEKLVEVLENYQIERLVLVPSLLRSLLMFLEIQKKPHALKNLKTWVCSGETLVVSLANEFFQYFSASQHQLCNFYGSTEVMGDVTYYIISDPQQLCHQEKVPIGLPMDNTIIYLLDGEFRPVKAGDVGELFVSGLNLAAGYVNGRDPDKFIENSLAVDPTFSRLYRTGDFARIEKGTILYEGRTDSQVKIRGHRVDLSEVEKAVNSIAGVDKVVVLCYKPGEINQALLAFVTTEACMNENAIEATLKNTLPAYMVPQVILKDRIPLLVNGKVDRQGLLKSYEDINNNGESCYQVDLNYSGVPQRQMPAAKILFETIASVLNRTARAAISIDANFYEIGGNSLNSIFTITRLHEKGYHISIGDFIAAIDLGEVLERMSPGKPTQPSITAQPPCYTAEHLREEHRRDVTDMITTSFYEKADLEQYILSEISVADYIELMEKLWAPLLEKNLSFIVQTESGRAVGVALNFDIHDEPDVQIDSKLSVIFEFLASIEEPMMEKHLTKETGKCIHSFMMGTNSTLTPKENITVMQFMEAEVIRLARSRGFEGIFTTNTSPLTQQLGTDIYGYQTLHTSQINLFVASDNTKPFGLAPDSQTVIVQYKNI